MSEKVTRGVKNSVYKRDGFICQYCNVDLYKEFKKFSKKLNHNTHLNITIDHIIPKSKGGDNSIENLVTCCKDCNRSKGSKDINYFKYSLPNRNTRIKISRAIKAINGYE